jgi:hypothetical protein
VYIYGKKVRKMYRVDVSYFLNDFNKDFDDSLYFDYANQNDLDCSDSGAGMGCRDIGFETESREVAKSAFEYFKSLEKTQYVSYSEDENGDYDNILIEEYMTNEFEEVGCI